MADKVALLDSINPAAVRIFKQTGYEVLEFKRSAKNEDLAKLASTVRLFGVRSSPKIPAEVIKSGKSLEAIGCFGVGTSHIDIEAASTRGVAVFNSRHENTRSVAEYVIAAAFTLLRRMAEHSKNLHGGTWTKTDALSYEVRGKTIGIIGYGAIGSQVSVLAESIGMDVIYFDPDPKFPPHGRAKRVSTMEKVLERSDIVTLHVPGGDKMKGLINAGNIKLMKPGSYLINASRGEVVDYQAAANAVDSGHLNGIAVDVYENEPANKGDKFEHILIGHDRAVLTPHIAASTKEAQEDIGGKIAEKLLEYISTGSSVGSVNLPILSLGAVKEGTTRLLNIHENQPGIMANISDILRDANLNVVGSALSTRGDTGYAAFDIEAEIPKKLVEKVRKLDHSRRTRIIANT